MSQCMSPFLARSCGPEMSALAPLLGGKQTYPANGSEMTRLMRDRGEWGAVGRTCACGGRRVVFSSSMVLTTARGSHLCKTALFFHAFFAKLSNWTAGFDTSVRFSDSKIRRRLHAGIRGSFNETLPPSAPAHRRCPAREPCRDLGAEPAERDAIQHTTLATCRRRPSGLK